SLRRKRGQETTGRAVRRDTAKAAGKSGHSRPHPGTGYLSPQGAAPAAAQGRMRGLRAGGRRDSSPDPQAHRSREARTGTARMGKAHGETAAQDTRGLRRMPSRHSRRAHSRVTHGVVTGEPVAGKLAWRVREGAAGKRTSRKAGTSPGSLPLPRKPAAVPRRTGPRAGKIRVIWRKLDCLNPSL